MNMSKFGLYGKITVYPGHRDAMVALLLEAAALLEDDPHCELYTVNVSPTESHIVWVTEVWRSQADHEASLMRDDVKDLIKGGMAMIAGGERIEVIPIGGKGLPLD